ncbi:MAG: hypothetical protein H7226_14725 [Salinibacterium sp.]|nr:hypothetical protein [Salinibacterium sp.]
MSDDTGALDDLTEAREVEPGPRRGQGPRLAVAVQGTDASGRAVILFDTHPRTP